MKGIFEKAEGNNLVISGKQYYALAAIRPYLKDFTQGDTVEFSTSKKDKGSVSFIKASTVPASKLQKGGLPNEYVNPAALQGQVRDQGDRSNSVGCATAFQQDIAASTDPKAYWDDVEAKAKAMHPVDRLQWAMKILEDMHGVPDRIISLARLVIKQKEEGDRIATQVAPDPKDMAEKTKAFLQKPPEDPVPHEAARPSPVDNRDPQEVRIVRQSCLKVAVECVVSGRGGDAVLPLAEKFEAWVWRKAEEVN
jgi:hypothetical protein